MDDEHAAACCVASRDERAATPIRRQSKPARGKTSSTRGMVLIPGGEFIMGTDDSVGFASDGEGPARQVRIDPFFMDLTAVTNDDFSRFVKDSRYETSAETFGWSFVFRGFLSPGLARRVEQVVAQTPWWGRVDGATWRRPEGPRSNIKNRMDHPVVHTSWDDALAYCEWSGKRLPTESEWEFAARGGLEKKLYAWGDDLTPNGEHRCNIWQGSFPDANTEDDGYAGTAPVKSFPTNDYGLYNITGNVWEWQADWFSPTFHRNGPRENPQGPPSGTTRTIRGGSYLCHDSYCNRYRVAARSSNTPDSSTGNLGFRCVTDA